MHGDQEDELLLSVALQNATSVLLARQRAEQELLRTRDALEAKTAELLQSLALMEATLRERDRARIEADEARRAAQEANDAKGRFLRMISHELRTPLGAIGGHAALLAEGIHGPINEPQSECIARILHNQKHLLGLVNELLDFAKIESGSLGLVFAPVCMLTVLENVQPMIETQIAARRLRLEVGWDDAKVLFYGDQERVEQIVLNLLSNAAKFTEPGGTITVTTVPAADLINLQVQDTGIGIPAEQLEAVFESFVQVAPSLSQSGGTGLGLAVSRQLARAMGGDLTAVSVLGVGSTFTLGLPRASVSPGSG